jgi:hypothetical protein
VERAARFVGRARLLQCSAVALDEIDKIDACLPGPAVVAVRAALASVIERLMLRIFPVVGQKLWKQGGEEGEVTHPGAIPHFARGTCGQYCPQGVMIMHGERLGIVCCCTCPTFIRQDLCGYLTIIGRSFALEVCCSFLFRRRSFGTAASVGVCKSTNAS